MTRKYKIVQHVFGAANSGGPVVALERILAMNPGDEFVFYKMQQVGPASGINLKLLIKFIKKIREIQPDVVHVRGLGNEGFHGVLAARLAGVKNILVSVHGTARDLKFNANSLRRLVVVHVLEYLTLCMASHIITVCKFASKRDFILEHKNKFRGVVHNGVKLPEVTNCVNDIYRKELGVSSDDVVAVCVSRITKEKGYFELAAAIEMLPPMNGFFHLWIVGDGPDAIEIKNLMPKRSDVLIKFLGHTDDVQSVLLEADFFIFPSLHENLSNALLEAMSNSLPSIAFDVGGNSEVLESGGGILIPSGDVSALSSAIQIYFTNGERRLIDGALARKKLEDSFSIDSMFKSLTGVYRDILGRA